MDPMGDTKKNLAGKLWGNFKSYPLIGCWFLFVCQEVAMFFLYVLRCFTLFGRLELPWHMCKCRPFHWNNNGWLEILSIISVPLGNPKIWDCLKPWWAGFLATTVWTSISSFKRITWKKLGLILHSGKSTNGYLIMMVCVLISLMSMDDIDDV